MAITEQALISRVQPHHRVLIRLRLELRRFLERVIEQLDGEVEQAMVPFVAQQAILVAVPGIGEVAAAARQT